LDLCAREQTPRLNGSKSLPSRQDHEIHPSVLVGYFVLVLGVGLALWQTGVFHHVAPIWIGVGALVAIGGGIMMSGSGGKPTVSEEMQP
jgi:hypothetical protein